jgi:hypothetical protein
MANPWERYAPLPDDQASGPWTKYAPQDAITPDTPAPAKAYSGDYLPMQPWSSSTLPVSSDTEGKLSFDTNAGILGALKRAFTLPGDVYQGNVQLPSGDPKLNPSGPGFDRAMELATALVNPTGPVTRVRPAMVGDVPAPSLGQLNAAADSQYALARQSGAQYHPAAVAEVAQNARGILQDRGIFPENAPQAHGLLNRLENVPADQPTPVSRIDAIRQGLGNLDAGPNRAAAPQIRRAIDDFVTNPPQGSVAGGNAQQAADAYTAARGDAAAAFRAQDIENLGISAADRAAATNSGQNVGNLIRSRVATLMDPNHPERLRGFSGDEVAALRSVLEGGPVANVSRFIGNLLGGGGGLGSLITSGAGAAAGGPWGAMAAPTAGLLLRNVTNRATERALNQASELVRQRSPSYQGLLAQAGPIPVPPAGLLGTPGIASGRSGLIDYLDQRRRLEAQ